jgi:uncharacterized protein YvpB
MTVKELRDILSQVDQDKEVRIIVENIIDNYGYNIAGRALANIVVENEIDNLVDIQGWDI